MDTLGKDCTQRPTGKAIPWENINTKPTQPADLYHQDEDLNNLVRRNHDDFPQYVKDQSGETSFKRSIDTTGKSMLKKRQETIFEGKNSLVHQSSLMKANGHGKFLYKCHTA